MLPVLYQSCIYLGTFRSTFLLFRNPNLISHSKAPVPSSKMEWTKKQYNAQYESWVPWIEDKYLAWFGENKTSYIAKGTHVYMPVCLLESSPLLPMLFTDAQSQTTSRKRRSRVTRTSTGSKTASTTLLAASLGRAVCLRGRGILPARRCGRGVSGGARMIRGVFCEAQVKRWG